MPQSITPLLAERLDIPTERAQVLLQNLVQELKSRVGAEGVQLSELGTFEEKDGTLTFVSGPSLRRRVNHQFEGLSPENLSRTPSARPEAEAPPSLQESSREEETPPLEPQPSTNGPSSPGQTDGESIPTIDPIEEDKDADPTGSRDEPVPDSQAPSDESGEAPAGSEDSTEQSIPTLDPIEEDPEHDGNEPEEATGEEPSEEEELVSSAGPLSLIGSLLILVVLVGIGWLVFNETDLWSSSQPAYENSDPETTQSADPEDPNQPSEEAPNDASGDDQPERHAGIPPGDDSGDAADMETGAWTIVVASLSSRRNAEATAAKYEDRFNSVEVMPATLNSRTRYRVAVGRYDSEGAAERALDANASMMPSGAWLHELR